MLDQRARCRMGTRSTVLLLASGGLDSTALIDFYLRNNANVKCVHFQYDQPNGQSEARAIDEISEHYRVEKTVIRLTWPLATRKDELLGRNVIFVIAASCLEAPPLRITLGIHSGNQYYDCSKSFVDDCQRVLDGYFHGTVRFEAPFLDFRKADIVRYCKTNKVPTHLTYSCQRQNYPPCGKCTSCLDRERFLGC